MKKQLAVLMAAATAVTTVAPVLANAEKTVMNDVSVSEVSKKMKEALAMKYETKKEDGINPGFRAKDVKDYVNSRYVVFVSITNKNKDEVVSNLEGTVEFGKYLEDEKEQAEFVKAFSEYKDYAVVSDADLAIAEIESNMLGNSEVKVVIVDKGVTKDKKSFVVKTNKIYVDSDNVDDKTEVALKGAIAEFREKYEQKENEPTKPYLFKKDAYVEKDGKTIFTLKSGAKVVFEAGMEAYNFEKAFAADGQELDLTKEAGKANQESVYAQIVKFGMIENDSEKTRELDVNTGDAVEYNIRKVYVSKIDVPTVYAAETGYTEAGAELINKLIDAKFGESNNTKGNNWFNYMGVSYKLESLKTSEAKIEKIGDKYVLKVDAVVLDNTDSKSVKRTMQFAFEGKVQKDLARVLNDLSREKVNDKVVHVTVGKFKKLAGMDRFDTAIQVSNETFENKGADSVVIVGANALMDGLSAAPLAAAKNAPVLLADAKMGLNDATVKEILRVTGSLNRKMVYVVGGMNSVPTSVDKMLSEKYGAVVVRLAGMDRYETSLKVLDSLVESKDVTDKSKLFLVGGEGAADAMSISSVAAMNNDGVVSPVVVVPQKGITKEVRNTIASVGFAENFAIGGDSSISSNVLQILADAGVVSKRIAGADRYATNAKVVKKFYDKNSVKGLIVTSGDTKYLVDAQTSGVLAGKIGAPVLLTGSTLSSDQMDLFNKKDGLLNVLNGSNGQNVIQVGGVVSADVMKVVVEKLGL